MNTPSSLGAGGQSRAAAALPGRTRASNRLWEIDLVGRVWHFCTSVRLALVLILLLTAAVLAGTLIDQAPPSVIADSTLYGQWLERVRGRDGAWGHLFR